MHTLNSCEIASVGAGNDCSDSDQSLSCPIADPQSDLGKMVDDVAGACNDLGNKIGSTIYDWFH